MGRLFLIFAIFTFCVATLSATAKITDGIHFYFPFNEGKGDVARDVGPKGFEAVLHDSTEFVAKGKVGGAIEFSGGPALIMDPGGQSELYVEHLTVLFGYILLKYQMSHSAMGTSTGTSFTTNLGQATITSNLDSVAVRGCTGISILGRRRWDLSTVPMLIRRFHCRI